MLFRSIEKEWKKIQKNLKKFYHDLRKSPKLTCLSILNTVIEIVKNNIVFTVFVLTNVFIGILLRFFTIHTVENLLLLKPILADLGIVLLIGSISFAFISDEYHLKFDLYH